jgi:hypothetical protein
LVLLLMEEKEELKKECLEKNQKKHKEVKENKFL